MRFRRFGVVLLAVWIVACLYSSAAVAAPAPGYEVFGLISPTNLAPGDAGWLYLYVYNIGGVTGDQGPTVTDILPAGVEATGGDDEGGASCTGKRVVTCAMPPIQAVVGDTGVGQTTMTLMAIPISVESSASIELQPADHVTVSGGGALVPTSSSFPVKFSSEQAGLGFSNFDAWYSNANGTLDTQAGSHPYDLTVAFSSNSISLGGGLSVPTGGEIHFINVGLPPGIVGDPTAVPQCTREQFDLQSCPRGSWIGEDVAASGTFPKLPFDVFNMVPPAGVAAQFAFINFGVPTFLDARVRSGGDNGITEHAGVPQRKISFNSTTIWGVPAEHNGSGLAPAPFLTLPTSCNGPQEFSLDPPVLSGGEG